MFLFAFYFGSLLLLLTHSTTVAAESGKSDAAAIYSDQLWRTIDQSSKGDVKPFPPSDNSYESPTTEIYISIGNFMDGERCAKTIDRYISKAKYPKRLNFGIIEQIDTEVSPYKEGCVASYCKLHGISPTDCKFENINSVTYSFRLARGLSYARATADEELMADEEFCLQSDSHVDLIPNWDMALLNMWGMIQNEYAVLSTQPTATSLLGKNVHDRWEVAHQCSFDWREVDGLLTNREGGEVSSAINLDTPLLSPTWTSKFSFSKCHAHKKTPEDPGLMRVERGVSDIVKFARMWTRGYDVYTPHRPIISRDSAQRDGSNAWKYFGSTEAVKVEELHNSNIRIRTMLGMEGGGKDLQSLLALGRYGLGTKRTLDQLIAFMGVDFRSSVIYDSRCHALSFVPFEFENNPHVESKDLWGLASERSSRMSIPLVGKAAPIISSIKQPRPRIVKHDYGQVSKLPSLFSWVDVGIENFVEDLMNEDYDEEEAINIVKVALLVVPIVAVLMTASLWALMSAGDDMRPAVKNDVKIV
mmetsp:Transcript_10862/g.17809  ORF Transcript_10862/g.17809 Transcript_10862/m.17809 type:complete len:530 (+) Transcript_10862:55-1644(+)